MEAMTTQWSVGSEGPTGLRYEALTFVHRALGLGAEVATDLFEDIRVMESAALETMRGKKP